MKTEVIRLYEERNDVTLSAYILEDSREMLKGNSRPAVIICPGGAYLSLSEREAEPIALKFVSMGYHAFVLNYSVYGDMRCVRDPQNMKLKMECQHPMPMREIGQSMLILREHAEAWKLDADKIILCGFSAGAHNAAMYATHWHQPVITDYFGRDKECFRPAALIMGYGLSDYVYMHETPLETRMQKIMFGASDKAYLGSRENDRAVLEDVSPARNVTENTPPTFLWATAADNMVPVQHTIRMANALADHKIPFELHIFQDGMHGMATATQASAGDARDIDPNAAKWTELCNAWLLKRFALEIPPRTGW